MLLFGSPFFWFCLLESVIKERYNITLKGYSMGLNQIIRGHYNRKMGLLLFLWWLLV